MTNSQPRETAAEMKRRRFYPGEVRAFLVPDTSAIVTLQRVDNGMTGQSAYVVMVTRSGVLLEDRRWSGSHEGTARAIAHCYIQAERVAVVGLVAAMAEAK